MAGLEESPDSTTELPFGAPSALVPVAKGDAPGNARGLSLRQFRASEAGLATESATET